MNDAHTTAPGVQVGWQDYLAVGLRRKWFFVAPFVVSMVVGVLVAICSPRIYLAQALILVQNEKLINPLIQGLAMPTEVSQRLHTLREEILSWSNLTRLIRTHHLASPSLAEGSVEFERVVQRLRDTIYVKMRGDSLIEVGHEGRDPAKVQELVNSLTDIVMARDAAIQEKEAGSAVSFIEQELNVYRAKLEESEKKLRDFKEVYMTQMPVATALNKQLKDLELQLTGLLISNTEEHPRVVEVKRQIEEVRRQRDAEIQRLVAKGVLQQKDPAQYEDLLNALATPSHATPADPTVAKAQQTYAALVEGLESPEVPSQTGSQIAVGPRGTTVQLNDAAASSLTLAPREQQELVRLTRDYSVSEEIYRGLLEKLERAKITGRLGEDREGGKFMILERARFPLNPVRPRPLQLFFISMVVGITLGLGAVVTAEYLDQSIQTAEEAVELLGVPALGSISTIVTAKDLESKQRRQKSWFSFTDQRQRFKKHVTAPLWALVDRLLLRWGL